MEQEERGETERGAGTRITPHQAPHEAEPSIRNEFAAAAYRMHGQVKVILLIHLYFNYTNRLQESKWEIEITLVILIFFRKKSV